MRTEPISLFSEGCRLSGTACFPDESTGPLPVIVEPPGFLGLASGPVSQMYHEKFTEAGYAVVSADYRGFGDSEGEPGWVHPGRQLEDLLNVVSYVTAVPEWFDEENIFCYGHGGTGGGNAIVLGGVDKRIRAVASQTAVADGSAWLRSMRTESEWQSYLRRLDANRRRSALDGSGEVVDPREDIMVATPERRQEKTRQYADSRTGAEFFLASADLIMRYRPIDFVGLIAPRPLLLVALDGDVVTPPDIGAEQLYQSAGRPKKILRQRGVSHYDAYRHNLVPVTEAVIQLFDSAHSDSEIEVEQAL